MAKKKGINKVATGVGIGVLIAIISVVFFTGIFDFIVPQDVEGLEIPVLTPSEIQKIQEIIDRIKELSDEDLPNSQLCLETPDPDIDPNIQFHPIEPQLVTFCNQLLQDAQLLQDTLKRIEELEKETDEILPTPDLNNTDTSTDPPPDQVCDEFELNCGGTPKLELLTSITKIDSEGNSELVEELFGFPLASLFVEEETNIDYSTGRLEIKLGVKGDQTTTYIGTGKVDLLIAGQSVLSAPLDVQVDGMGEVDLLFGGISDTFTFSIEDNFDKFVNQEVTPIAVQVKELNISDGTENFSMADQEVFVMNILRDDFRVLIVDEEGGGTQRVYPTDSVLKVTGATTAVKGTTCTTYNYRMDGCPDCRVQYRYGDRNAPANPDSCLSRYSINTITFDTDTARVIGLNLLDDSGKLLQSFAGGQGEVLNELLQRNTNYTLTTASPELSTDLSFPKSQQTQSYTCTNEYKIIYRIDVNEGEFSGGAFTGGLYQRNTLVPDSFIVTKVDCNFPN